MAIEITGGDTTMVAQEGQILDNIEQGGTAELSLETPEQAESRVAAMGQIAENNRIAEVAQATDFADAQPKIEEIRQALGAQTEALKVDVAPHEVVASRPVPIVEQVATAEAGSYRYKKFSESELFTSRIESATDIQSLMRRLAEGGDITRADGYVYKKEDTLGIIGSIKDSKDLNLQRITNTHGLRDKVRKLLLQREIQ